jgi:hypothetical protein
MTAHFGQKHYKLKENNESQTKEIQTILNNVALVKQKKRVYSYKGAFTKNENYPFKNFKRETVLDEINDIIN